MHLRGEVVVSQRIETHWESLLHVAPSDLSPPAHALFRHSLLAHWLGCVQ
jgi:hypothetical protein